jgi:hypothetical protein
MKVGDLVRKVNTLTRDDRVYVVRAVRSAWVTLFNDPDEHGYLHHRKDLQVINEGR